jgi:hypothetical protein
MSLKRLANRLFIILLFSGIGLESTIFPKSTDKPICELNVFVHGTYGPAFALLSYFRVKKDNLNNTAYLAVQRAMRETELVLYRRFSGRAGFLELTPGTSVGLNNPARYVIGAYDAIRREVEPNNTDENRYFLFGWSGLLSQRERRSEAICLYNELAALAAEVEAQGKTPVINLYCHSHGCNVALNLALVDACSFDAKSIPAGTEPEVVTCMNNLLAGEAVTNLSALVGEKKAAERQKMYVRPQLRLQTINHLLMLCLPVQPETAPLVTSSLFGSVLQIYSDNDGILYRDTFSSKKLSTALFDPALLQDRPLIKVIRWMNNRTSLDFCQRCEDQKKKIDKKNSFSPLKDLSPASMNRLKNGGGNPDSHHEQDPTHADFWAIGNLRDGAFFEQVPLFVFIPLIRKLLLEAADDAQYFDFCLQGSDSQAQGLLFNSTQANKPELSARGAVSLRPVQWARSGIKYALNVTKKLEIAIKIRSPFFKKS